MIAVWIQPAKGVTMLPQLAGGLKALLGPAHEAVMKAKDFTYYLWKSLEKFPTFEARRIEAGGTADAKRIEAEAKVIEAKAELREAEAKVIEAKGTAAAKQIEAQGTADARRLEAEGKLILDVANAKLSGARADLLRARVEFEHAKAEQMRLDTRLGHKLADSIVAGQGRIRGTVKYADSLAQMEAGFDGLTHKSTWKGVAPANPAIPPPSNLPNLADAPGSGTLERRSAGAAREGA
jgi:hypothetical protein